MKCFMKEKLLFLIVLGILNQPVFTQELSTAKPYKLVKTISLDNQFTLAKGYNNKLGAIPLIGRGSSYGYGGFVETGTLNKSIQFFLCSTYNVRYFDQNGVLIEDRFYAAPERPRLVSRNGKYILVSNYESGACRMEMFDGSVLWQRDIARLTKGLPAMTPGRITNDGRLILEISPCLREFSGCLEQRIEIYDVQGNAIEMGNITAGEIIAWNFTGNISPSGRYYAISCVRKNRDNIRENVVALYDLNNKVELWRHVSGTAMASNIFVTNDGRVITHCGRNVDESIYYLCFFDVSGKIIKSYLGENLFFMSPDGEYIVSVNQKMNLLSFWETSSGEVLGQVSEAKGTYIRSLSNNGLVCTKEGQLFTIKTNGLRKNHNQKIDPDYFLDIVYPDASRLLFINWKKRVSKLYKTP